MAAPRAAPHDPHARLQACRTLPQIVNLSSAYKAGAEEAFMGCRTEPSAFGAADSASALSASINAKAAANASPNTLL